MNLFKKDKPREISLFAMLESDTAAHRYVDAYHYLISVSAIIVTVTVVLSTHVTIDQVHRPLMRIFQNIAGVVLLVDFLLRIYLAVQKCESEIECSEQSRHLKSYLFSYYGFIDFIAVLPLFMNLSGIREDDFKAIFGIISFLKLARYSPALTILKDVAISERKPLLAALYLMLILTLLNSTILYFVERNVNPEGFGSLLHAMWWSIITLATVGYGDVVPVTPVGKLLGGMSAILGFGMFALPAGILASGFAQEVKRLKYVTSWNMVANVPIFSHMEAGVIAEIARLLRVKRFIKNEIIVKEGDTGDAMYFILDGEVEVKSGDWKTTLKNSDFFGEIALVKDIRRTATVTAKKRCETLELSTYDFKKYITHKPEILAKIEEIAEQRQKEHPH